MSTLMITLMVAFLATVLAITFLAIGWLISGRSRIVRGSCGMNPQQARDADCGKDIHCGICDSKPCEKTKDITPDDHANPSDSK